MHIHDQCGFEFEDLMKYYQTLGFLKDHIGEAAINLPIADYLIDKNVAVAYINTTDYATKEEIHKLAMTAYSISKSNDWICHDCFAIDQLLHDVKPYVSLHEMLASIPPSNGLPELYRFIQEYRRMNESIDEFVLLFTEDFNDVFESPQSSEEQYMRHNLYHVQLKYLDQVNPESNLWFATYVG